MRIGKAMKFLRAASGIGVREQAKEIGISAATLSRIERGVSVDVATLVKLLTWMVTDDEEA